MSAALAHLPGGSLMHVVVLGGGSTGEHFVGALRRYDREARVTVVERRVVGGECSYWACMPTKTMLRAPGVRAEAERTLGALSPGPLDAQAVYAWRDVVAERDDSSQVEWLDSMGARLVRGEAVIEEPGFVTVGDEELRYDKLLVATGSSPVIPDVVDGIDHWTNHDATETTEVPETLLVLGGGPVGCELAQFFARLGSKVTLAQAAPRLLPRIDPEAGELVEEALREDGVEIRLDAVVDADEARRYARVLVATGRKPNVDGLEPLGLTTTRRGIEVDERMRAAPDVWAAGDVTGIAPFTHVGKYHARVVAADIAGRPARADHRAVPVTIFTDPQVATVGTLAGKTARWERPATPRLSTYERPKRPGFVKVAVAPERRVVTGAVAVGPEAGE